MDNVDVVFLLYLYGLIAVAGGLAVVMAWWLGD